MTEIFNAVQQSSTNLTVLKRRRGEAPASALGGFYSPQTTNPGFATASASTFSTSTFGLTAGQSASFAASAYTGTTTDIYIQLPDGQNVIEEVQIQPGTAQAVSQSLRRYWAASYPMVDDQIAGRYGSTPFGATGEAIPPLTGENAFNVAPRGRTRGETVLPVELEKGYNGRFKVEKIWTPHIFVPQDAIFTGFGSNANGQPNAYPVTHQICGSILENYKILVPYQSINLHFLVVTDMKIEFPAISPKPPFPNGSTNTGSGPDQGGAVEPYEVTSVFPCFDVPIVDDQGEKPEIYFVVFPVEMPDGIPSMDSLYGTNTVPGPVPGGMHDGAATARPVTSTELATGVNPNTGQQNGLRGGPIATALGPWTPGWEEYGGISAFTNYINDELATYLSDKWLDIYIMKTNDDSKKGKVFIMPANSFGTVDFPLTGAGSPSSASNEAGAELVSLFTTNSTGVPINFVNSSELESEGDNPALSNIEIGEVEYCVSGPRCVEIYPGIWQQLGLWLGRYYDNGTPGGALLPALPSYTDPAAATGWTGAYDPAALQNFWNSRILNGELGTSTNKNLNNCGLQWSKETAQNEQAAAGNVVSHRSSTGWGPTPDYIGHPSLPNGLQVGRVTSWKPFGTLKQLQDFHTTRGGLVVGPGVRVDSSGNTFRKALALRHKDPSRNPEGQGALAINNIHMTGYITDRGPSLGLP